MQSAELNGTILEYDVQGAAGEPVLLIHGSIFADGFKPLLAQPALAGNRLIYYHRRGYGGSGSAAGRRYTIAHQAADAEALLDHLGVPCAHIVGHSYGGIIALQLVLQTPQRVHSLTLLEPPLFAAPGGEQAWAQFEPLLQQYAAGDRVGALETFLGVVNGPAWREQVEAALGPDAMKQALAHSATFFEVEMQALRQWRFDQEIARRITAPAFCIAGDETTAFLQSSHETLVRWITGCMQLVIFDTTHLLQVSNPRPIAEGVARFLARQPMPVGTPAVAAS